MYFRPIYNVLPHLHKYHCYRQYKFENMELTKAEQKFIDDFKKLAKRCPKSLWLFSGDGILHIMKMGSDGKPVQKNDLTVDGDYSVTTVRGLYSDGGGF